MGEAADVMRRKIETFNAQDAEAFAALMSPDVKWEVPGVELRGPDQVVDYFSAFWEAFPDLKLTITRYVENGSDAMMQGRSEGTHLGTLHTPQADFPATGRSISLTLSDDIDVHEGRVTAGSCHFDRLTILEQIGAVPAPTSA
jgi:steroid delta-isomerase-like uncharacterized protein